MKDQDLVWRIHRETQLIMDSEREVLIRVHVGLETGSHILSLSKKFERDMRLSPEKLFIASGMVLVEPVIPVFMAAMMTWPTDEGVFKVEAITLPSHGDTMIELFVSWPFAEHPENLRSIVRSMHRIFNAMKAKLEAH